MSANIEDLVRSLIEQGRMKETAAVLRKAAGYRGSDEEVLSTLFEKVNWEIIYQEQEKILKNQGE